MLNIESRFWTKVAPLETISGCWNWMGAKDQKGYGQIRDESGRTVRAYRWAYEHLVDAIPDGLQIDHLCRNRGCVNPAHLEPVTARVNILRGNGLTAQEARRTHCPRGHPYSGDNLHMRPNGSRRCRACHRLEQRRYASVKALTETQAGGQYGQPPFRDDRSSPVLRRSYGSVVLPPAPHGRRSKRLAKGATPQQL